jgi:hypothetical protein
MKLSREDHARLDRLASEVRRGGGLALPSLFSALLGDLLDNGPADPERMIRITSEVCANKTMKLAETWQGSWEFLTTDALHQLASKGYVATTEDGRWQIGDDFVPGVRLEIIPARKGLNAAEGATVYPREQREALSHESWLESELARLIRQPRGKSHDQATIKDLRDSAAQFGKLSKITKNRVGEIIDGRHRHDIDPNWPAETLPINPGWETLAAIRELDRWKDKEKLSPAAAKRLDDLLAQAPRSNAAKRERVEAALREDPARSNRVIAEQLGVQHNLVAEIRADLEKLADSSSLRIHVYIDKGGRGGGKTAHSTECWCGQGTTQPKPEKPKRESPDKHPDFTDDEVAEFHRLVNEERMSLTGAEAKIRGWDKPRASLTTAGNKARNTPPKPASSDDDERKEFNTQRQNWEAIWNDPERLVEELLEDEVKALNVYHILHSYYVLKAIEENQEVI